MAKKKIINKNKKPTENNSYYFVAHVDSDGEFTPLLLTDVEYNRAKVRADNNPEDVPEDFIAFSQEHRKNKNGK